MISSSSDSGPALHRRNSHTRMQSMSPMAKLGELLNRVLTYQHMDFESAFSQMVGLCTRPRQVYRNTVLHRQIKNQWARDDPAFVAVLLWFMLVAASAFSITFGVDGVLDFLRVVSGAVILDFLGIGIVISTCTWAIANRLFRVQRYLTTEQSVEWLYAFDVHCNAFFPLFVLLYVAQFFLAPMLLHDNILSVLVSNTLYVSAICYYWYITFLGFDTLPFLQDTSRFLYPIALSLLMFLVATLLRFNSTIFVLNIYYG